MCVNSENVFHQIYTAIEPLLSTRCSCLVHPTIIQSSLLAFNRQCENQIEDIKVINCSINYPNFIKRRKSCCEIKDWSFEQWLGLNTQHGKYWQATGHKDRASLLTIYIEYQGSIKNQITKDTVESPFFHLINTVVILKSENGHLTWKKIMATSPYRKSPMSLG